MPKASLRNVSGNPQVQARNAAATGALSSGRFAACSDARYPLAKSIDSDSRSLQRRGCDNNFAWKRLSECSSTDLFVCLDKNGIAQLPRMTERRSRLVHIKGVSSES